MRNGGKDMGGKSFRSLVIVCAMALMTAFLLVGCQSAEQPLQEANQLSWRELPAEQQTLLDDIGSLNDQQYYYYDYQVQDAVTNCDVWVETYRYGVLQEDLSHSLQWSWDESAPTAGSLIIIIGEGAGVPWAIANTANDGGGITSATAPQALVDQDYLGYSSWHLTDPQEILVGEETVLYWDIYADEAEGGFSVGAEMPDLSGYPLAHVLKVRFSAQ